jgi:predicted RNase H-like nuclease (RuvC/YqgF family)
MTLVIDHQALAKAPMPDSSPVAGAPKLMPASESQAAATMKTAPVQDAAGAATQDFQANGSLDSESLALNNDELLNKKLDELRDARKANKLKDSEIATLKKEAVRMKKELRQRAEEVKALKASKASARPALKKKSAEAHRVR